MGHIVSLLVFVALLPAVALARAQAYSGASGLFSSISLPKAIGRPEFMGPLLVGAVVGLVVFAVSYALRVVLFRHSRARDLEVAQGLPLRIRALVGFGIILLVAFAFIERGDTGSFHAEGMIRGDQLFSVMPRTGLFPQYPTMDGDIPLGGAVVKFIRVDDINAEIEKAKLEMEILTEEASLLATQALEASPSVLRTYETARRALSELDSREQSIADGRAELTRQMNAARIARDSRDNRQNKELRSIDQEIKSVRVKMKHSDKSFRTGNELFEQGLLSRMELDERKEAMELLKSSLVELRERQRLIEEEMTALTELDSADNTAFEQQIQMRIDIAIRIEEDREPLEQAFADAQAALAEDLVRARRIRDKRLRKIRSKIRDYALFLEDPSHAVVVSAPWAGKVGFREASPMSLTPGQGPLLVMYQPNQIWTRVLLEEAALRDMDLERMDIQLSWNDKVTGREYEFDGRLLGKEEPKNGFVVLRLACDPPPPAIRSIATGKPVPALVTLSPQSLAVDQNITVPLGLTLGAALLIFPGFGRRRKSKDPDPVAPETMQVPENGDDQSSRVQKVLQLVSRNETSSREAVVTLGDPDSLPRDTEIPREDQYVEYVPNRGLMTRNYTSEEKAAAGTVETPSIQNGKGNSSGNGNGNSAASPRKLGAELHSSITMDQVDEMLLHRVRNALSQGHTAALLAIDFGDPLPAHSIYNAGLGFLARSLEGETEIEALRETASLLSSYLKILDLVGADRIGEDLGKLRMDAEAALRVAARQRQCPDEEIQAMLKGLHH
jgi:hypothetical protein